MPGCGAPFDNGAIEDALIAVIEYRSQAYQMQVRNKFSLMDLGLDLWSVASRTCTASNAAGPGAPLFARFVNVAALMHAVSWAKHLHV